MKFKNNVPESKMMDGVDRNNPGLNASKLHSRRKPRRKPRKAKKNVEPEEILDPKEILKNKLKQKLREKKLERTSQFVRDKKLDELEDRLEESKNPTERRKLKDEIQLLETIDERQAQQTDEYPDYGDSASYGGSFDNGG